MLQSAGIYGVSGGMRDAQFFENTDTYMGRVFMLVLIVGPHSVDLCSYICT